MLDNSAKTLGLTFPITLLDRADEVIERLVFFWQILLKKSLMISGSSDSVAVMRFAVEAGDDGAARSRSRAAVLFILS